MCKVILETVNSANDEGRGVVYIFYYKGKGEGRGRRV